MTQDTKERMDHLKESAKSFIDNIDTDTEIGQRAMRMIYGFTRAGYRECGKVVRHE